APPDVRDQENALLGVVEHHDRVVDTEPRVWYVEWVARNARQAFIPPRRLIRDESDRPSAERSVQPGHRGHTQRCDVRVQRDERIVASVRGDGRPWMRPEQR